jgi:hypothetical protein
MAVKAIKDSEKVAVGAIRTALQTWLAPQLSDLSALMTHVESRLDGIDRRHDEVDKRLHDMGQRIYDFHKFLEENLRSMRNEIEARFDAVRSDIKSVENMIQVRARLVLLEPGSPIATKLTA